MRPIIFNTKGCCKIVLSFLLILSQSIQAQQQNSNVLNFLNLKFGMFIHYNMGTYTGEQWAYPFNDPKKFKPSALDCDQWAVAAKSAGMKYAVLTSKHHDGFCLWNSKVTNYDIASARKEFKNLDIVKKYVDAFRNAGLTVGLYYSVWDRHHGVEPGNINEYTIAFTKAQLTELLTNYGDITCLVIDGWGSRWGGPGFEELPYHVLADHIHSLQPNCLVINHSCRVDLAYTQIVHYEATHGQHIPYDNTFPSQQGPVMQPAWFWEKGFDTLTVKPAREIIDELEYTNKHYSNYLLNAAPNDKGLMDDNIVNRLKEVGQSIKLSAPLKSLPEVRKPHKNVFVKASSSLDNIKNSGQNILDCNLFTEWKAAADDNNPWVEIDFGKPETFNCLSIHGGYNKSIKKYIVEALINNVWTKLYIGGEITYSEKQAFKEVIAQKYRLRVLEMSSLPEIFELTFVKY